MKRRQPPVGPVRALTVALSVVAAGPLPAGAQEAAPDAGAVAFFDRAVYPVLRENCFKCHGGGERLKAHFRLTSREGLLRGGDLGPAVNLEEPSKSLLLEMVSYKDTDHQMPPRGKLPQAALDALAEWAERGFPYNPEKEIAGEPGEAEAASSNPTEVNEQTKNYWAYRPVGRPEVPRVADPAWQDNPIDAFIYAGLSPAGLKPNGPAPKEALIRRAFYDLIGLPPTPAEVGAFVRDDSPDALEKVVEDLLSRPQYGEKWGRHWLDLVRYAETNGYERDSEKTHAWLYRDYVIESFNQDKPYDVFIKEQIAGDELDDPTPASVTATGYHRLGIWDDEPADRDLAKFDYLDDIAKTTGEVMLAMTIGCARCHDHKIDPIPARDYYSFLAFFRDISNHDKNNAILSEVATPEELAKFRRLQAEKEARESELRDEIYQIEEGFKLDLARLRGIRADALPNSDLADVHYRFYRDTWEQLPPFNDLRHETEGRIASGFFSLKPASRDDAIGLVLVGKLRVPADGEYTFHLEGKDGYRLKVGSDVVVEHDGLGRRDADGRARLTHGYARVRLEYFNKDGKGHLRASWSGPGFERRPLTDHADAVAAADGTPPPKFDDLLEQFGPTLLGEKRLGHYRKLLADLEATRKREIKTGTKKVMAVQERGREPTFVLRRGNPRLPAERVEPAFPSVLSPPPAVIPPEPRGAKSSGKRRVLAEWIASEDNPLTARVMANRIWQHHFGRGIVRSASDFGNSGEAPTHPGLLDWLARDFMAKGWSIKALHRQIMLSRAYQMSSADNPRALAADPINNLFWRFDMRRLTAEEIRDSILALTGTLNLKMGGPEIYPPLPKEVLATSSTPHRAWGRSSPEDAARRSVYIHVKRSLRHPFLVAFDQAETDSTCAVRFATTVPTQSLTMLNSKFINDQAKVLAERIRKMAGDDPRRQVEWALGIAFCRPAVGEEIQRGVDFMGEMRADFGLDADTALERFCLLVINLNEFVYLD